MLSCQALPKSIGRFTEIESGATWSRLFRFYQCTSTKFFEAASACPPGYCDHVDCGKLKTGPEHAFQRTCRQAYAETADLAHDATSHTALQFAELRDLMAFSMMLTNDQREDIRHIRVNLDFLSRSSPEWHYFCNVFATLWDRRSIQHLFKDSDYPNHKADISFYYNYSSRGRLGHDSGPTFASSWVKPNVHFGWKFRNNSWSTEVDLSLLRARTPLSVRFAIPQFLFRTKDLEIDINHESMWDDEIEQILYPGDEGHVRLAERCLTEKRSRRRKNSRKHTTSSSTTTGTNQISVNLVGGQAGLGHCNNVSTLNLSRLISTMRTARAAPWVWRFFATD